MLKENKGVTLVALVITIIVLLILAGVTLSMVLGDSGIFGKANTASVETNLSNAKDAVRLALLEAVTNGYNNDGTSNSDAVTSSNVLDKVSAQLTSVGDGYTLDPATGASITDVTVKKDNKEIKNESDQSLKATFADTNGSITVTFECK